MTVYSMDSFYKQTMKTYGPHFTLFLVVVFFILGVSFSAMGQGTNTPELVLNSNGFNVKKRSNFKLGEITETLERGLTLVHVLSPTSYEYLSFDTYGSEGQLEECTAYIKEMMADKVFFAILAHDSAVKGTFKNAKSLEQLGLSQLAVLKSREAYVMYYNNGEVYEAMDVNSLSRTLDNYTISGPEKFYFPKITYEFEPSNDRYIAHAGGEVKGIKSTNSKQALDENYAKGFRLFELDIITTADGKMVAAHDWGMWSRFTDFKGNLPPTHAEFKKHKIYGDYTTLDMDAINAWFAAHPDAILITDKLNDPVSFANKFVDKDRLIMELFSALAMDEASRKGINVMISQQPLLDIPGDKVNYLKVNNINYVALSRRIIRSQLDLLVQLRDHGIKVYVYNVNFDPGKDEKYVQENEIGLVYGMYADKWVFDED